MAFQQLGVFFWIHKCSPKCSLTSGYTCHCFYVAFGSRVVVHTSAEFGSTLEGVPVVQLHCNALEWAIHAPTKRIPRMTATYSHGQMELGHKNMNQDTQIARFLSMQVQRTRGLIQWESWEIRLSRYTDTVSLLDLHKQYVWILRVLLHIFVLGFHLAVTAHDSIWLKKCDLRCAVAQCRTSCSHCAVLQRRQNFAKCWTSSFTGILLLTPRIGQSRALRIKWTTRLP